MPPLPVTRILTDEDLSSLGITAQDVVSQIEQAIRAELDGRILTAPKSAVVPDDGRYMMTTLATADDPQLTVVKSVMVSPRNPARGLAGIEGNILIQDSETGLLRAVMGAKWVTEVRTAGLSAVAATRLANPASKIIAFVGCGAQARSHLNAFAQLFPLKEVRAVGRTQATLDKFCTYAESKSLTAQSYTDPHQALQDADIVVTSITLSYDVAPFLDARWLKPGAFATITDLALPWMPDGMPSFETLIIDDRAQEAASPKPMVSPDLISGDLKELINGSGFVSFNPSQRSAFVFRGLAVGDFAMAAYGYQRAVAAGIGAELTL